MQYWATVLVMHVLLAIPLMKMAARAKEEPLWFAWVPVLNGILALRVAKRPIWWILLLLIPIVNLVMAVLLLMALCERFRTNKWWGLFGFITPANLIIVYYLAYGTKDVVTPVVKQAGVPDAKPPMPPSAPPPSEPPVPPQA